MLKIIYITKYDITNFPFNRALALWRSNCNRWREYNITNISNELDMEHNVSENHNDSSYIEVHVQNVKNAGRHEKWKMCQKF